VLPLLNAILPNVVSYHPFSGVMTMRRQPGLITLYPDKVMITQVAHVDEGLMLLAAVRDLLNQTWARRDEIQPKAEGRRVPRPLDVYELLPRTNCRACGEATCMAFAFGLLESRHRPEECPSLADPAFVVQHQALCEMLPSEEDGQVIGRDRMNMLNIYSTLEYRPHGAIISGVNERRLGGMSAACPAHSQCERVFLHINFNGC
jgi:ArsR family metal-binding transcriptional regulator